MGVDETETEAEAKADKDEREPHPETNKKRRAELAARGKRVENDASASLGRRLNPGRQQQRRASRSVNTSRARVNSLFRPSHSLQHVHPGLVARADRRHPSSVLTFLCTLSGRLTPPFPSLLLHTHPVLGPGGVARPAGRHAARLQPARVGAQLGAFRQGSRQVRFVRITAWPPSVCQQKKGWAGLRAPALVELEDDQVLNPSLPPSLPPSLTLLPGPLADSRSLSLSRSLALHSSAGRNLTAAAANRLAALTRGGAYKLEPFAMVVGPSIAGGIGDSIHACVRPVVVVALTPSSTLRLAFPPLPRFLPLKLGGGSTANPGSAFGGGGALAPPLFLSHGFPPSTARAQTGRG